MGRGYIISWIFWLLMIALLNGAAYVFHMLPADGTLAKLKQGLENFSGKGDEKDSKDPENPAKPPAPFKISVDRTTLRKGIAAESTCRIRIDRPDGDTSKHELKYSLQSPNARSGTDFVITGSKGGEGQLLLEPEDQSAVLTLRALPAPNLQPTPQELTLTWSLPQGRSLADPQQMTIRLILTDGLCEGSGLVFVAATREFLFGRGADHAWIRDGLPATREHWLGGHPVLLTERGQQFWKTPADLERPEEVALKRLHPSAVVRRALQARDSLLKEAGRPERPVATLVIWPSVDPPEDYEGAVESFQEADLKGVTFLWAGASNPDGDKTLSTMMRERAGEPLRALVAIKGQTPLDKVIQDILSPDRMRVPAVRP